MINYHTKKRNPSECLYFDIYVLLFSPMRLQSGLQHGSPLLPLPSSPCEVGWAVREGDRPKVCQNLIQQSSHYTTLVATWRVISVFGEEESNTSLR